MSVDSTRYRHFVLTAGRTGSTLLAAILADAGADFAMPAPKEWDTARGGVVALPEIRRATTHFRLAFDRSTSKPPTPLARWIWGWHRSLGKRLLKRALDKAVFVKANDLDLAIPFAIKIGYFPRLIVSYREFDAHVLSASQMLINWSIETMAKDYDRSYRNAVLQLHAYGGCVVHYDDLVDAARTDWARSLAEVTGLSADALLASRTRRARPVAREEARLPVLYESVEHTFAAVDALSGRALPPSPQALRNWAQRARSPLPPVRLGSLHGARPAKPAE